jgi:hypothetical protein
VRRELLLRADPGGAGQAAHQLPQVALAEPPAAGGGQQRPGQLPPLPHPGPLRPVGQVGVQGHHSRWVSGIFAFRAPLRTMRRTPVTAVFAQVADIGGASLVGAQGVVQQQSRRAGNLTARWWARRGERHGLYHPGLPGGAAEGNKAS